jgi:RNA polymerase sigma-70 factor, ECF subfamily
MEMVERIIAAGRTAYPDVELDLPSLRRHIEGVGLEAACAHPADVVLAAACVAGNARAVTHFEHRYIARIPSMICGLRPPRHVVGEIQQRVRERLLCATEERCAKLSEYAARGSLMGFVRIVATREALMERRRVKRERRANEEPNPVVHENIALAIFRSRHEVVVQQALEGAVAALDARERDALRLSYFEELSIDQIGKVYRVHRATAARWVTRARSRVRELTQSMMQRRLRLDDSETQTLLSELVGDESLSATMRSSLAVGSA